MHTKRLPNLVLGVATVLPVPIWLSMFIAVGVAAPENYNPPPLLGVGAVLLFGAVTFIPLIVLVLDAMRNQQLSESQRTQWVLILVLLAGFTMPIYFWQYRWPRVKAASEASPA